MGLSAGDVTAILRLRDELSGPYRQAIATMKGASSDVTRSIGTITSELKKVTSEIRAYQKDLANPAAPAHFKAATVEALKEAAAKAQQLRKEFEKVKKELADDGRPTFLARLTDPSTIESLRTIGTTMTTMVTLPIVGVGVASAKMATDFETSMTRVHTLSGVTVTDQNKMRQAIMALAPAVGIGPKALADAMLAVTSTGIRGAQAIDILTISARAAATGLGDATVIARTLTSVIKAYGEENITAARAAEIIFKTAKDGNTEASELAGTLGRVIGIASQVGVSFEDVGAYIATFTRLGVDSAEAVTALRGTLSALLNPTQDARDALDSIGLTIGDLRQQVVDRGLTQTMIGLVTAFNGNEEAIAAVIPNVRALAGVLGTAGAQAKDMTEVERHLKANTDELNQAFAETADTTEHKWNALLAQLQVLAIEVGEKLLPQLKHLIDEFLIPSVQFVGAAVDAWEELPGPVKVFSEIVLVTLAAGGPVMLALGSLASMIRSIQILMFGANVAAEMSLVGWLARLGGIGRLTGLAGSLAASGAAVGAAGAVVGTAAGIGILDAGMQGRGSQLKNDIAAVLTARKQLDAELKRLGPVNIMGVGADASGFVRGVDQNIEAMMRAAEATRRLKEPTDAQKRAAKDLAAAHAEVRAATIPLTDAQAEETKTLLALGVSHQSVAREVGAHIVQVKQFAEALETQERAATSSYDALRRGMARVIEMRQQAGSTPLIETDLRPLAPRGLQDYTALHLERFVPKPSELLTSLSGTLAGFPQLMVQAMTGGGGVRGAVQALGSGMGADLTKSLAASVKTHVPGMLGGALSSLIGPLGAFLGPVLNKLWEGLKRRFGGPSEAEVAGRDLVAGFEDSLLSALTTAQYAEAAGVDGLISESERWRGVLIGIRDQYIAVGKSPAEAEAALKRLWDAAAQGPAAVRRVIDEINGVIAASRDATTAAETAASAASAAWSRQFDDLEADLTDLVQTRATLLKGINAEQAEDEMGVIETAARAHLDVLEEEIAKKGEAYAQLAKDTGREMADAIVDAIREIHLDPIHAPIVLDWPRPNGEMPEPDPGANEGGQPGFATGTPGLGFVDFGAGRNVTLHGQEAVIPRNRMDDFLNQYGAGGATIVIQTNLDGREVARSVVPLIPGELRRRGVA